MLRKAHVFWNNSHREPNESSSSFARMGARARVEGTKSLKRRSNVSNFLRKQFSAYVPLKRSATSSFATCAILSKDQRTPLVNTQVCLTFKIDATLFTCSRCPWWSDLAPVVYIISIFVWCYYGQVQPRRTVEDNIIYTIRAFAVNAAKCDARAWYRLA